MKIIITESQDLSLRKLNFLKEYIENLLPEKYPWIRGIKIDVSSFNHKGKELPLYNIIFDTGGYSIYSHEDGPEIEEDIGAMVRLLFPSDKDGELTAVWDSQYK